MPRGAKPWPDATSRFLRCSNSFNEPQAHHAAGPIGRPQRGDRTAQVACDSAIRPGPMPALNPRSAVSNSLLASRAPEGRAAVLGESPHGSAATRGLAFFAFAIVDLK